MRSKNGLELILIAGRCSGWTEVARVRPGNALPRHIGSCQIRHAGNVHRPVVNQISRTNVRLDAGAAINLHRPRRDPAELVLNRCSRVSLDDEARHAATCKKQCRRQPVETAAHDEDWCACVHVNLLLELGPPGQLL